MIEAISLYDVNVDAIPKRYEAVAPDSLHALIFKLDRSIGADK